MNKLLQFLVLLSAVANAEEQSNIFKKIFEIGNQWDEGFGGNIHAPVEWGTNLTTWQIEIKFVGAKLDGFQCWNAIIDSQTINVSKNETEFKLINNEHNGNLKEGETTDVGFTAKKFKDDPVPAVMIKFNDKMIENQLDPTFVYVPDSKPSEVITSNDQNSNSTTTPTETDDAVSDLRDDLEEETDDEETEEDPEDALPTETPNEVIADKLTYNYKEVVSKSILFYAAQRSGRLPENNKVHWRGNSAMYDKATSLNKTEVDLTGGYYDAGDFLKLGFPLAFSMTTLSWGTLHYWNAYIAMGNLEDTLELIKWGVDWIIKCIVMNKETGAVNQIFVQVDTKESHMKWDRPESIVRGWPRPAFSITKDKPGTDIASEYAAALASAHLLFKRANEIEMFEDGDYVNKLRNLAKKVWTFSEGAKKNGKGVLYSDSVPEAKEMYPSSHYQDERVWAALWLYRATGDATYYDTARQNIDRYKFGSQTAASHMFSWDDKQLGIQLLASQVTRRDVRMRFLKPILMYCSNKEAKKTKGGLWWVSEWAPNRYAANSAFLCLMAAEYVGDDSKVKRYADSARKFARGQGAYLLGRNPNQYSYVVGFGEKWPRKPHHRGASCPAQLSTQCNKGNEQSSNPNPSILFGALVGGPDAEDNFEDNRNNYKQSEVALDYNSCFQGLMAGLFYDGIFGQTKNQIYSAIAEKDLVKTTTRLGSGSGSDSASRALSTSLASFALCFTALLYMH